MAEEAPSTEATKNVKSVPGEELSATYTNYFYGHVGAGITRISFGEWVAGAQAPTYTVAVAMTTENAKLLIGLLSRLIAVSEQPPSPPAQQDS